jgi:ribosomal protein S18 acetylase RimI-like enzyme
MTNLLKSNIEDVKKEHGLNKKDFEVFSNNLAVSFKGYPLFEYFSNNKYNIKKMKKFWKVSLKTMSDKTFFLADSEDANSLAIFSPYEKGGISIWKYIKAGGLGLIPTIGIKMTKKMAKFEKFAMEIKNKHAKPGCWYLYVFVTMPEFRGKGVGKKILAPMCNYLDEHQQDCYLETLLPINIEIYKKFGFELKEEVKVPNSDLTLYAMLRTAKSNNVQN